MIRRAIFLAASKGRRLNGHDVPSPLTEVGGTPLIKRALLALEHHGIQDAVVVVGYRGEEIRRSVTSDPDITTRIVWVENPNWHLPDISSLIKARPYLDDEPTLVLSPELVFAPEILTPLLDQEEFHGDATLLVDRKLSRVYDLGSALKVRINGDRVGAVGMELESFDAVALGIAVVQPQFIENLEDETTDSLVVVLNQTVCSGRVQAQDINGSQWQQVTSPETKLHAEWLLRAYGDDLSGHASPGRSTPLPPSDPQRTLSYIEGILSEKSARHYILFNPGPVLTSPRVKSALVHHDVCHRDSDYSVILRRLQRKLRRVCRGGPEHDIVLISGSGTASMEATLASCVPADGKLLVVSNGAFGERFAEIAEVHGIQAVHLRYDWGEAIDPAEVDRILAEDPEIVATIMCHNETSVGLLNPVQEVGEICRRRDQMYFVDAVSSLAGEDLDVRRDKIDVLISSANKCLHAISGVSFVCVNKRIWNRIEAIPPRVYYLDLKRYHDISRERSQTPFTPAVSNFFALDAALDDLLKEGVSKRLEHYREINTWIRSSLRKMGLRPFTDTGHESSTISTISVPDYISFPELYEELKSRGYIVYACKDHLKDRFFQIANMGDLSDEMIQGFLDTLGHVLREAAGRRRGSTEERAALVC
jgi:2-aminoethylphosphonate-pyruvate transaminase